MISNKKISYPLIFSLALIPLSSSYAARDLNIDFGAPVDSTREVFELDELDEFDSPELGNFLAETEFHPPTRADADAVLELLKNVGAIELLKEQTFCNTNPLNERSLLDLPLFLPQQFSRPEGWTIGGHLFWNQTSKQNFTTSSTSICSYLSFCSPSFQAKFNNIINSLPQNLRPTLNIMNILNTFGNTRIQERRLGLMFQAERTFKSWALRFFLPLYYLERNFFLTNSELEQITRELGESSPGEQERFKREHLISDKIGFGDTRIELDFFPIQRDTFALRGGFLATIPTGFSVVKGIAGSSFDKCSPRPEINFEELFQLALDNKD